MPCYDTKHTFNYSFQNKLQNTTFTHIKLQGSLLLTSNAATILWLPKPLNLQIYTIDMYFLYFLKHHSYLHQLSYFIPVSISLFLYFKSWLLSCHPSSYLHSLFARGWLFTCKLKIRTYFLKVCCDNCATQEETNELRKG